MGFMVVAAAVAAAGAIAKGASDWSAANAQKNIAKQNAEVAGRNAALSMAVGENQAEQIGMRNKAIAGKIKAEQGSNGVDVGSGSAKDIQTSQRALGLFDTMTLKSNAAREAFGFKVQAKQFTDEAAIAKTKANQAILSGAIGTASSLLSAAKSSSAQYDKWQDAAGSASSAGDTGGMSIGKSAPDNRAILAF